MNVAFYLSRKLRFGGTTINARVMQRIAVGTVALSVSVMLISFAVMHGFRNEVSSIVKRFNADVLVQKLSFNNTMENEAIEAYPDMMKHVLATPGVKNAYPMIVKPGIINTGKEIEGIVLRGITDAFDSSILKTFLVEGRYLHFNPESAGKDILISSHLARRLQLQTGSKLPVYFMQDTVRVKQFVVSGIYESGMDELDNKYAWCDMRHLQKVNRWDEKATGNLLVNIEPKTPAEPVKENLNNSLGNEYAAYSLAEMYPQLFDWLALVDTNAVIISVLMLVVSCISMITVLMIVILDKTQTIGTFKALGMSNTRIILMFWYKAALIVLKGILWGNIICFGLAFLQMQFHIITLPRAEYYVSSVPMQFQLTEVLIINAGTFILCMLCMLVPVQIITRINTVQVLRFE